MAFITLLTQVSILLLLINFEFFTDTNKGFGKLVQNTGQFKNIIDETNINPAYSVQGASWADYNNDGNDDLLISGNHLKLYKNTGNGKFELISNSGITKRGTISASVFGDYNNDGCQDLYLVNSSKIYSDELFKNNCNGTFTNVSKVAGITDNFLGRGASWADYNNDGYLDIYVANFSYHLKDGKVVSPLDGKSVVVYPNLLYRNNGNGTFTNVIKETRVPGYSNCGLPNALLKKVKILNGPDKPSFQPVWFDYNHDGNLDLFVANDGEVSPLYKNSGNGTFTDVTKEAGLCRLGSNMGVTVGDYNNDSYLDIYTTNVGPNFFWHNNGNGTFTDVAAETKTADMPSIGWGTSFLDFNNDGFLDLYVTNGVSSPKPINYGNIRLDRLFQNIDGKIFNEVSIKNNINGDYPKYASAISDFDNNGFPDILVMYRPDVNAGNFQTIKLYKNYGNGNNWIALKLVGRISNRDGIGAKITITSNGKSQSKEVVNGSSFMSQNSLTQLFGIKDSKKIDKVTINWPSGTIQTVENIKANQKIVIEEK